MYSPISLEYFLNMEVANGGPSKQIMTLNGKLKYVKDIVKYWINNRIPSDLTSDNWQYYNCMMAGFRHDVANHHDLGWSEMTEEYYNTLIPMGDDTIQHYLETTPIEFNNGFIKHSMHRAYAMIGRLVRGEKYIPFYMETDYIYGIPSVRLNDANEYVTKVRTSKLTSKINLLSKLDDMGIDRSEYCLCQSSILSVMGIRDNDDLDIIISSNLRKQNIQFPAGVDLFDENRKKFDYFGADGDDDILQNFCIEIDGYKFLEPRFYFARKNMDLTLRDESDWDGIRNFFKSESQLGYPFNTIESYKWGLPAMAPMVNVNDLDLTSMELIKDKYTRIVGGVNQGRAVYKSDGYFAKIFHPEYCRLENFRKALSSGFLNGIAPSLLNLITDDNDEICGYVSLAGEMASNDEFDFDKIPPHLVRTILRNSQKRKMVFYDLVPINVIKDNFYNQWGVIDLESVYELDKLDDMKAHNSTMKPPNMIELINSI